MLESWSSEDLIVSRRVTKNSKWNMLWKLVVVSGLPHAS